MPQLSRARDAKIPTENLVQGQISFISHSSNGSFFAEGTLAGLHFEINVLHVVTDISYRAALIHFDTLRTGGPNLVAARATDLQ